MNSKQTSVCTTFGEWSMLNIQLNTFIISHQCRVICKCTQRLFQLSSLCSIYTLCWSLPWLRIMSCTQWTRPTLLIMESTQVVFNLKYWVWCKVTPHPPHYTNSIFWKASTYTLCKSATCKFVWMQEPFMHDDAVNTIQKLICVSRYLFCGTTYVLLRFKYLCSAIHVVTGLSSFNDFSLQMKFFFPTFIFGFTSILWCFFLFLFVCFFFLP